MVAPQGFTDAEGEDVAWKDTLPAAGLLADGETAMLLSPREQLGEAAETELSRLFNLGPVEESDLQYNVFIPGAVSTSLSQDAENGLRTRFAGTFRVAGSSYAGTAAALADVIAQENTGVQEAIVVSVENPVLTELYADAIAMSAVAADRGLPILYVGRDLVPPETCDWLDGHDQIDTIHVAGGEAAVSEQVRLEVAACAEISPTFAIRHGGVTRIETAAAIANAFFPDARGIALADGFAWPDAVTGANVGAQYHAPVLLTNGAGSQLEQANMDYVARVRDPLMDAWVLGGSAAVSDSVEAAFESAVRQ